MVVSRNGMKQEKGMESKNRQIIDAAIEKFSEKGFAKTTMQEIAESAGVGKGTIYRFFDSKEDMVSGLIEAAITEITGLIRERLKSVSDPVEKLLTVISVELDYYERNRDLSKFLAREVWGFQNKFADHIRNIRSNQGKLLEEIIRDGIDQKRLKEVDPETAAAAFEGMILATTVHWFMFREGFPREWIFETVKRMSLQGLLVSQE